MLADWLSTELSHYLTQNQGSLMRKSLKSWKLFSDDSNLHDFAIDRSPMTATERGYSSDEEKKDERPTPSARLNVPTGGSPISGILKGGKLWKQPSLDGGTPGSVPNKMPELQQVSIAPIIFLPRDFLSSASCSGIMNKGWIFYASKVEIVKDIWEFS